MMYQLEDRILFDAAAPADVADAQNEADEAAEQQEQQEQEQQEQQNAQQQDASYSGSDSSAADNTSVVDQLLIDALDTPSGAESTPVNVMVISSALGNADSLYESASASNSLVVVYDPLNTTSSQLLQMINDALDGRQADAISFAADSADDTAGLQLFADADTTLESLGEDHQQQFWSGVGELLDPDGRVDLFGASLGGSDTAQELADAIADTTGREVDFGEDDFGDSDWASEYSAELEGESIDSGDDADILDAYYDGDLASGIVAEDALPREVAFINSSVMNADQIIAELDPHIEVVFLERGTGGMEQITEFLNAADNPYNVVHLVTHGNEGYFVLNGQIIDADAVQQHAPDFVSWRNGLSADADIMIYGCNLAGSDSGRDLLLNIASATGADVAASIDSVGGGDWSLEYQIGDINYNWLDIQNYDYQLADQLVTSLDDAGVNTLRWAIGEVGEGQSITFSSDFVPGSTITLTTGELGISKSMSIDGNIGDGASITVSGNDVSRIFYISNSNATVYIENMILTAGSGEGTTAPSLDGKGGAIYTVASLTLENVTFNANSTIAGDSAEGRFDSAGGAIYNTGTLTVNNSTFTENFTNNGADATSLGQAGGDSAGGAIYNAQNATLSVYGTLFEGNYTGFGGDGMNGDHGAAGAPGGNGAAGENGTDGDDGAAGQTGFSGGAGGAGEDGIDGDAGVAGQDGGRGGNSGGGAIYNQGTIISINSTLFDSNETRGGGGIYNDVDGKLLLNRVTVSNNTATAYGGGIFNNGGAIQAENVTVSNNTATENGGGIYSVYYQDADETTYAPSLLLQNVTVNNNTVGTGTAAGIYSEGNFYGYNLTVAQHREGGVANDYVGIAIADSQYADPVEELYLPLTYLENVTVALNDVGIDNSGTTEVNLYNSLVVNNDTTNISGDYAASVTTVGSLGTMADELADNGGWVQTLALTAQVAGENDGATLFDARGYMRNDSAGFHDTRSRGAYQYDAAVALNVNRGGYYTSIQAALNAAKNGETIELVGSRIVVDAEIEISDDVIIRGQGSGVTVLDATDHNTRILYINDADPNYYIYVRIQGVGFTGGDGSGGANDGNGGAIYSSENLLLKDVSMYDNTATSGGAFYNDGGYVVVQRSELFDNSAENGGAIYNNLGTINATESTFRGNVATTGSGGAVFSDDDGSRSANITISSSVFHDNSAAVFGGAIYAEGVVEFTNTTLAYNEAVMGGAVFLDGNGNWKFTNVTVAYNTSSDAGAGYAVQVAGGTIFLINDLFANNTGAGNFGYAVGAVTVNHYNSIFTNGDYFASEHLSDHGGWVKTLALKSGSAAVNNGTDIGVPGYDARGYLTQGTRDIGAYESNGYIGTVTFPNHDTATTVSISNLNQIDDHPGLKGDAVVSLINSRILESDVDVRMWYNTGVAATPRAARNITIYGHVEGGTVISAGMAGGLFTLLGTSYGTGPTYVMGTLTLSRMTVADTFGVNGPVVTGVNAATNVGGFVANEVAFVDNVATGRGGAIYVPGWNTNLNFSFTNCLFADNLSGGSGGAVYAAKPVTLNTVTVAHNRAFGHGGGIMIAGDGNVSLSQSTVAFNYASGRGGGIFNAGTLNGSGGLNLIAKNRDTASFSDFDWSGFDYYLVLGTGKLTHGNVNLVEFQNGSWTKDGDATHFFQDRRATDDPNYHDVVGAQDNVFRTGYLADNGGWVESIQLSDASRGVVVDNPHSSRSGTDQRGYGANNFRDIGAIELNGVYAHLASTDKHYSTIAGALAAAAADDVITLRDVRIIEHDITVSALNLTIDSQTTAGDSLVRGTTAFIDALGYGRVFFIGSTSTTVSMNNLYLTNGISLIANPLGVSQAAGSGGAIYNAGTLTAEHLSVTNSFAQISGGGIYSSKALSVTTDDTRVSLITVQMSNNSAGLYGGAVYASGSLAVSGNAISGEGYPVPATNMYNFWYNSAGSGGAIYTASASDSGGVPALKGVYLRGNSAFGDGGGLYATGGSGITIAQSYLLYNSSMSRGGAVFQSGSNLTVYDTTIDANFAFSDGGAIYFTGGYTASMTIYGSSLGTTKYMNITNNYSLGGDGGAIYMTNAQDLNIYSEKLLYGVTFSMNHALDGDGGAIYFTNSNNIVIGREGETVNNVRFTSNEALNKSDKGHGGAIYMSNSVDLHAYLNVFFRYNQAETHGGAIYALNSNSFSLREDITIVNNWALEGHGGGIYLEKLAGSVEFNYLELGNNIAGGDSSSAAERTTDSNGGGAYIKDTGNITLVDVNAYDNIATLHGGALYITDSAASDLTIRASGFYRNIAGNNNDDGRGGAVYVATAANAVLLENVSFGYNLDTAFHLAGSATTTVKYTTFAYNSGTNSGVSGMYVGSGDFAMTNSVVYETAGAPVSGDFNVVSSSNNIFYRFDQFADSAEDLASTTDLREITAYNDGGGVGGSASVLDADNNIVGLADTNGFITANLYLSTEMIYHANYLTRAMALESRDSIAYRYELDGVETRAGVADSAVKHDQRGNLRSGVTINTAEDGAVTYVYYEYDSGESSWMQVTVAEDGSAERVAYEGAVYTSVGAFEPNFYIVVTTNSDNSTNPSFVVHASGSVWHDFDVALTDAATAGLTLREAIFWIDAYKLGSTNNSSGTFSEDGGRYVKFAESMTDGSVEGRNVITLDSRAEYISIRNDVIIGMIDNYTDDGTTYYDFFKADNTFTDQDADNNTRITVSGGNHSRVFAIFSMEDYSAETGQWAYSAKAGINNITIADGLEDGSGQRLGDGDGRGGGIYNEGTLTLHNTVIKDSEASNVNISSLIDSNRSDRGQGGGIYTVNTWNDNRSGYLYLFDSTLDNNIARGTAANDSTINVAMGGGLYVRNGNVNIVRSTISANETWGFAWPEGNPTQTNSQGGGIYVRGGTVSVNASTVTDNATFTANTGLSTAFGDGIYQYGGTLTLNSNTIAYNRAHKFTNAEGYAVWLRGGTAHLTNNIIANNYVHDMPTNIGRDIYAANTVATDSNNIIGAFDGTHNFKHDGNITGNQQSGAVDKLYLSDQLKYNGGMSRNYRLGADSVAINFGNTDTVTSYDQRGMARATDGAGGHSAGSYELLKTITAYTNVADEALAGGDIKFDYAYRSDSDEAGRFGWETNLRNALYLADQGATATINIADDITEVALAEGAGALLVFNDVTILAADPDQPLDPRRISINAANGGGADIASRAFIIDGTRFEVPRNTATNARISGFDIMNTYAAATSNSGHGGAIYSRGHLVFENGDVSNFSAAGSGGAFYLTGGNLTIANADITHTGDTASAAGDGGAIFIESGSILVGSSDLTISGTIAGGSGGGIYIASATQTFNLVDSRIENTRALAGSGGGVYYTGGSLSWNNVTISGASAASTGDGGSGGGLYAEISGTATIRSSAITGNQADNSGGGIYLSGGSLALRDSSVSENTADNRGGGIYVTGAGVTTENSSIIDNESGSHGGGIYAAGSSAVEINYSTVGRNVANGSGGGVYVNAPSFSSVNSTYSENTAGSYGGGIYFSNPGSMSLTYVTIANNISGTVSTAETEGGGIYINRGTLNMTNTIVAQNYTGSIGDDNHNDLYLGNLGVVGTVTYSIIGINNYAGTWHESNYVFGDSVFDSWAKLGLSTELEDNGGDTMTLYIYNYSIAIGAGTVVGGITTDQRGIDRATDERPDGPTIGAYEKMSALQATYYYVGDGTGVGVFSNWVNVDEANPTSFTAPDLIFVFNDPDVAPVVNVTIDTDWTLGSKTTLEIRNTNVTIVENVSVAAVLTDILAGASLTVNGTFEQLISAAAEIAGTLTVNGAYVGQVELAAGALLTIAAADANVASLSISSTHADSTVSYNYAGDQTIKTLNSGDYGNLTVGGSGTKTYSGDLATAGNLTFSGTGTLVLSVGGDLLIDGDILVSDTPAVTLTVTGDIDANAVNFNSGSLNISAMDMSVFGGNLSMTDGTVKVDSLDVFGDTQLTGSTVETVNGIALGDNLGLSRSSLTAGGNVSFTNVAAGISVDGNGLSSITTDGIIELVGVATGPAINVSDTSTLTVEFTGETDILLYDTFPAPGWDWNYNMNNAVVAADSELRFVTAGVAGLDISTGINAFAGTLGVEADQIQIDSIVLNNASLFLKSEEDIELGGEITINGSLTFAGNVLLTADSDVTSNNGAVNFTGTVNGGGNSLIINAVNSYATLNDLSNLFNLTVNSGDIRLQGDIVATGAVGFQAGSTVTIYEDASITAAELTAGDLRGNTGNESFSLNISGTDNTLGDITNLVNLTVDGGNYDVNLIEITGTLINSANNLIVGNGLNAGSVDNRDFLRVDADMTLAGNLTNSGIMIVDSATLNGGNLDNAGHLEALIVNASGNFTNTGTYVGAVTAVDGSLTNSGDFTDVLFTAIGGNLVNTGDFESLIVTLNGNLTTSDTLTIGDLELFGTTRQDISISGVADFGDVQLDNPAGATLTSGTMELTGDFSFGAGAGMFTIGNNSVQIDGDINGGDIAGQYFAAGPNGRLIMLVDNTADKDFYIGTTAYGSKLSIQRTSAGADYVSVGNVDTVTAYQEVVMNLESTVKRTWTITGDGSSHEVAFSWPNAMGGSEFRAQNRATLQSYDGNDWKAGATMDIRDGSRISGPFTTSGGALTLSVPGAVLQPPQLVDITNQKPPFTPQPPLFFDVPDSEGEASYLELERRWRSSPLTNPLSGEAPRTGSTMGYQVSIDGGINLLGGRTIYGSFTGEYSLDGRGFSTGIGTGLGGTAEDDELIFLEEELVPGDGEGELPGDVFAEMADRDSVMEKHPVFKTDVDRLLDELLAV